MESYERYSMVWTGKRYYENQDGSIVLSAVTCIYK